MSKKRSFIYHGGLLAITSIVVRLIGFFYRVPLVRILGEEGVGYYSGAFEVYAFLLIVSSYGMPAAISKLISKNLALKKYDDARNIFIGALLLSLTVGTILSLFLFFYAQQLATLSGNSGSFVALRALTPALFIFSILAVFRGYFQGHNTMVPTAMSQLIEQVFNAVLSLVLALYLLPKGLKYGASGGTLGTGIGAFAALVFMVILFVKSDKTVFKNSGKVDGGTIIKTWKIIFLTAFPMILGSSIYNLSNLTDMVIFQNGLAFQGFTEEQVSFFYGIMASKYRLIITVPIAMASAFGAASIPSITTSITNNDMGAVKHKVSYAIKIIFIVCLPSIVGLMVLGRPILYLLFGNSSLELTTKILFAGAPTILFFSLSSMTIALLQGVNKITVPVKNSAIAIAVKIVLLTLFNFVFMKSIAGSIIVNYIFSILVVTLNMTSLNKVVKINIDFSTTVIRPFIASAIMGVLAYATYYLIRMLTSSSNIAIIVAIAFAGVTYFVAMMKLRVFSEKELSSLGAVGRIGKRIM